MAVDGQEQRTAQLTLPPKATSPARARRFVAETLAAWDAEGAADDALLIVSELVTNALLHARTGMTITVVDESPDAVRLSVSDGSAQAPQERHFSPESGTGRGLHLLDALALEWGVDQHAGGKTVWCRVPLAGTGAFAGFDIDAVEAL